MAKIPVTWISDEYRAAWLFGQIFWIKQSTWYDWAER